MPAPIAPVPLLVQRWKGRLGWLLLPSLVNLARSRQQPSPDELRALITQRAKALVSAGLWADKRTLRTFDLFTLTSGRKRDLLLEVQDWIQMNDRLCELASVGETFHRGERGVIARENAHTIAREARSVRQLNAAARVRLFEALDDHRATGKAAAIAALAKHRNIPAQAIRRAVGSLRALRLAIRKATSGSSVAHFERVMNQMARTDPPDPRLAKLNSYDPAIAGQAVGLLEIRFSDTLGRAEKNGCDDAWRLLRVKIPIAM